MNARLLNICLILFPAAFAQQAPQPAPQALESESKKFGVLEGQVLNAKTGEPVRRVNVTLRPFGGPGMAGTMMMGPMAPAAPYAATTDAGGTFRIEKVEPGTYRMSAERQGFVRQEYGARQRFTMGTTIRVSPGQELKDLSFKLIPQAVISGRVLDEEGEPLARVQVQVLRRGFFRGKQQLMPMGGGMTLDTGEYRMADLSPGRYWLAATHGRVMFAETPARNTADKPEEEYVRTFYPGSLDEAGARPIEVEAGQELPGMDIRLQKARVYRVRGKVAAAQSPRPLRVMLLPRGSGIPMGFGAGGIVKEDGTFEIGGIQPGSYYLAASPMQGMMSILGKVPIDVGHQNVEDVTLTLGGAVTLMGNFRIDGDVQQMEQSQGRKITFGVVRVQLTPMEMVPFGSPPSTVKDDGSFMVENVAPDKYRIGAFNLPQGTWLKSIRAGDQEVLEDGIDLSGGAPGPIQITLGTGVGQITGIVQGANQQPAPGSMVTLLPDPMKEERRDLYRVSTTDQNGQFTLEGVAPGEYKLFAWEEVDFGAYSDPEFLKPHESKGQKITVAANGTQQVTLVQIPASESVVR